ncbi:hypoxanthine-guanine phosphoribosyltransferase [Escherichia coli]|uniref:Hypoxanthine-guanine phosphoribosyltransferase n=1 Tax=Escherichia coli TaxID=562 RepID=A0A376LHT4_ECOLX|nr:hypoxanthine-guanine phosphoribosyltransferase [Escherichia coli]
MLIVEDIIDSGNTLSKVREILSLREPKSLAICTLLDKPSRREVNVPVEFIGFSIPDEFVVGYGIDYAPALPSSAVYRQSDSAGRVSVKLPDVLHPAWHFYLWLACFSLRLEIP